VRPAFKPATLFALTTCVLLGTTRNSAGENPCLSVFVYNDAQVSPGVLSKAELRAAMIFARAGLDIIWLNRAHEMSDHASSMSTIPAPDHLMLRITPHGASSTSNAVFGMAFLGPDGTGRYGDVFWERVQELHTSYQVDLARVLASVMAHEIGHLLLGSNGHSISGIMRARWESSELRQVAMGTLVFLPWQEQRMRATAAKSRALLVSSRGTPAE
jgi:hypothetical protein